MLLLASRVAEEEEEGAEGCTEDVVYLAAEGGGEEEGEVEYGTGPPMVEEEEVGVLEMTFELMVSG